MEGEGYQSTSQVVAAIQRLSWILIVKIIYFLCIGTKCYFLYYASGL